MIVKGTHRGIMQGIRACFLGEDGEFWENVWRRLGGIVVAKDGTDGFATHVFLEDVLTDYQVLSVVVENRNEGLYPDDQFEFAARLQDGDLDGAECVFVRRNWVIESICKCEKLGVPEFLLGCIVR